MQNVNVRYRKNFLSPVTHEEQRQARGLSKEDAEKQTELYEEIGMDLEPSDKVQIERDYLEREWVEVADIEKPEKKDEQSLNQLWKIFNNYNVNPLAAQNDEGEEHEQPTIQDAGVDHTSMSIGDIVEIDGTLYIACSVGWAEVEVIETVEHFFSRTGIIHYVKERVDQETVKTECGRTFEHVSEKEVLPGETKGPEVCRTCRKVVE